MALLMPCGLRRLLLSYFLAQLLAAHVLIFNGGITSLPSIASNSPTWAVLMVPRADLYCNHLFKGLFPAINHEPLKGKD